MKTKPRFRRLIDGVRHAFSMQSPHGPLMNEDLALLDKLAEKIVQRRMVMPVTLFLQSVRPLNAIGSQTMIFLRPFLTPLFKQADYDRVAAIMERREGLGALLDAIEAADAAQASAKEASGG